MAIACHNDLDLVHNKLVTIKQWAESRGLDWSMETVFKRWNDLDELKPQEEKKPYLTCHDGTKAVQIHGEWRDYDNIAVRINTSYYPELTKL